MGGNIFGLTTYYKLIDTSTSSFRDAANERITQAQFFALTGVRVSAEGTVGTGNLVATKVRVRPARTPR